MVLVTGASGAVGSAVCRALTARGTPVAALVRSERARAAVIAAVGAEVPMLWGDVERPNAGVVDAAAWRGRVGCLLHLAAVVRLDADAEPDVRRVNVEGTRHVLELAEALGRPRVMLMSTAAVAGDAARFTEDDADVGQAFRNPYERSKLDAEALVRGWSGPSAILRMPALVGHAVTGRAESFTGAFYRVALAYWMVRELLDRAEAEGHAAELGREGIARDAVGRWALPEHVPWAPDTPCEVVSEDWLAAVVVALLDTSFTGTLHVLHPDPPPASVVMEVVLDALGVSSERRVGEPGPWSRLVRRTLGRVAGQQYPYLSRLPRLSRSRLSEVLGEACPPAPPLDEALLRRLVASAVATGFGT